MGLFRVVIPEAYIIIYVWIVYKKLYGLLSVTIASLSGADGLFANGRIADGFNSASRKPEDGPMVLRPAAMGD